MVRNDAPICLYALAASQGKHNRDGTVDIVGMKNGIPYDNQAISVTLFCGFANLGIGWHRATVRLPGSFQDIGQGSVFSVEAKHNGQHGCIIVESLPAQKGVWNSYVVLVDGAEESAALIHLFAS